MDTRPMLPLRASVMSLAAAALLLSLAAPGLAAESKKLPVAGTNWFWEAQERTSPGTVSGQPCPQPPPHPLVCTDPPVGAPSPHEIGALPVQMNEGKSEKVSAVLFDLSEIVPEWGAEIHKLTFSVTETPDSRDRAQTVGASGRTILACLITDGWTPGEGEGADDLEDAPPYDANKCVPGTRNPAATAGPPAPPPPPGSPPAKPARWEFDITTLVGGWGEDPLKAYGVMLVGKDEPAGESWQIVLKGPRPDDPNSTDNPTTPNENEANQDESELNKDNITADISYTLKPEPKEPKEKGKKKTGKKTGGGSTGSSGGTGSSAGTGSFGFGSTPTIPSGPGVFDAPAASAPTFPTTPALPVPLAAEQASEDAGARTPGYVWLVLPLGLVGLSLARAAVLEPIPGKRPDGVVALIRSQNAARRGAPLAPDAQSPFSGVTRFLQRTGSSVRTFVRRVITGGS